jgi:hypothetical protein
MSGYLDHYGAGYEQSHKRKKMIVVVALLIVVGGSALYLTLRNFRQKAKVTQFVELLQKRDYSAAYRLWGCTEAKPCPDYSFQRFMDDWGPRSQNAQIASFHISHSRSCGTGVIVTVELGANREERFWVESNEMTIGFSPWSVCPAR